MRADANAGFQAAYELISRGAHHMAVRVALTAAAQHPDRWHANFGLAAILIDAGARSRTRHYISEAIHLLEPLVPSAPVVAQSSIHYNLGNAYLGLGGFERGRGPLTRPSLAHAVSHLAASLAIEPRIEPEINMASAFVEQGRCIEAIDLLTDALRQSGDHPMACVAYATRARAAEGVHNWMLPHQGLLEMAFVDAECAVARAEAVEASDYQLAYQSAVDRLRTMTGQPSIATASAEPAHAWIWEHGLALNPCGLCGVETPDAFDTYVLQATLAGGARRPSSAEVAEIVNAWHRTFSTARWNLLQAAGIIGALPDDHVVTTVGLSRTRHDLRIGLLITAITGFYSVFDKVAYGLNMYLHLGHKPNTVNFARIWGRHDWRQRKNGPPMPNARADLHPALATTAARPLSALYHLAWSIETGQGVYRVLRELRNEAEHRLVVAAPHDASSSYFSTIEPSELERQAIALGRLAKAAMWYAGGTLWWREAQRLRRAARAGHLVTAGRENDVRRV